MPESLAGVSGVETLKVLAGAVDLPDFTVDGLARHTGVSRRTVDTVRRRYGEVFERLDATDRPARGRPAVLWRLQPDQVDRVMDLIGSLPGLLSTAETSALRRDPDRELADALIAVAADHLGRMVGYQANDAGKLVSATWDSLTAAGFSTDGTPLFNAADERLTSKAAFVASVANLIDAVRSNQQERIDDAQATAFSVAAAAAAHMPADGWLPLTRLVVQAPGTVLCSPLLVKKKFRTTIRTLFPSLKAQHTTRRVTPDYIQLADSRIAHKRVDDYVTSVEFVNNDVELESSARTPSIADRLIFVSGNSNLLGAAQDKGALFVLKRRSKSTRISIAKAVNQLASGLI